MPSQIIEGIRAQFFASLGITENTPISDSDAANLIDQWEQYLYSRASGQGVMPRLPVSPLFRLTGLSSL